MIDVGPVHVSGAMKARNSRVIWTDGTLYVTHRRAGRIVTDTTATTEPVEPSARNGIWLAESDTGVVKWSRKGCGG